MEYTDSTSGLISSPARLFGMELLCVAIWLASTVASHGVARVVDDFPELADPTSTDGVVLEGDVNDNSYSERAGLVRSRVKAI